MVKTLLVAIDTDPTADMEGIAEDVRDILETEGYAVQSVKAWNTHDAATLMPGFMQPAEEPLKNPSGLSGV